jgi:hypothetical protein
MAEPKREPVYLEGEVREGKWEVKMIRQDKDYVYFRVYCNDEARDWFQLNVKCPKKKFRRI